ncbi:MAG: COX15/CtaA family protein, partial [Saprospiraceae bacterium]|nr:COX15/CtaA family protein [Saprospiraceae bacterium]
HRLWARAMGFIFLVPFILFLWKGALTKRLVRRLLVTVLLAGLAGIFGWIMVASGLVNRPWVNAYKLTIHLGIALILYSYHFQTVLLTRGFNDGGLYPKVRRAIGFFLSLLALQIFFGGLMSGMKAALVFPTFPDMHGSFIPNVLLDLGNWSVDNVVHYDKSAFMPALIQVTHRSLAYLLVISQLYIIWKYQKALFSGAYKKLSTLWIILLITQVVLGVSVLLGSVGTIPIYSGVAHQAFAILLLSATIALRYRLRDSRE